jgi:hypothetical protein
VRDAHRGHEGKSRGELDAEGDGDAAAKQGADK